MYADKLGRQRHDTIGDRGSALDRDARALADALVAHRVGGAEGAVRVHCDKSPLPAWASVFDF